MGEKKIVAYHDFGSCPKCGTKMMYMLSTYQLAIPGPGGTSLSKIIGEDKDITGVCPNCNNKVALTSSIYGITTKNYENLRRDRKRIEDDRKLGLIGFIDEKL